MTPHAAPDFSTRRVGSSIYIKLPDRPIPLRFTRTTEHHWKRTDGLAVGRQWVTHEELAVLANQGHVTNPFTKENKA